MLKKLFLFSILAAFSGSCFAQAPPAELVLFEQIPMVVSPGKKLQPLAEASAPTYVLDQEQIRMYGGINLYEPLRQVPGVNVMTTTIAQPDVAIRGMNQIINNTALLLLDGRNLYLPAQGFFMWDTITIQPDEVKQIEVVKGPVASLYGANALQGLINIVTKTPEEVDGTYFTEKTNFHDVYTISSVVHGQRVDDWGYKVSAGWKRYDYFYRDSFKTNLAKVNAQVDYYIDEESTVSLSSGGVIGEFPFISSTSSSFLGEQDMSYLYTMLDCDINGFEGKVFWNHFIGEYDPDAKRFKSKIDVVEAEMSYNFELFDSHDITVGTGIRYDHAKANIWGPVVSPQVQTIWNAYFQDDWEVMDNFRLIGSGRMDYYTISGLHFSGRIAGIFTLFKDHFLRASLGNAFRAPTFSEYYLDIYQNTPTRTHSFGQKDLEIEEIVTGEVGYEGHYFDRKIKVNTDFFVSYIKNFIDSTNTGIESFVPLIATSGYLNQGNATTWGVESSIEYRPTDWLMCFANHTQQMVNYDENAFIRFTPRNMWNLGVLMNYDERAEVSFYWHYVGQGENVGNNRQPIDKYSTLNARLGYWITENMELAVSGSNILLDQHTESPGQGEPIGRRVLAELRLRF
ncbi:MAG: TonB-dependent receptor [Candidatus Omnitrophica bacterium]|nr:TonB-dependent receptor [Candidatus Omnitrophota bacterium]